MEGNILLISIFVGGLSIIVCIIGLIVSYRRYVQRKKIVMRQQKIRQEDQKILQGKMNEIKLNNKGKNIDSSLQCIIADSQATFMMKWSDGLE